MKTLQHNKFLYKLFIIGFFILYLGIALISFVHSIQFFNIGNELWMSIVVGACFELGNFLSLAAILLSNKNKKATMPWVLLIIMVSIQCIANTYSTFKFISLSDTDYYQYLASPLLFWIQDISQETVQIIISWIIGAILPIVALFMTDMVASNVKNMQEVEDEPDDIDKSPKIVNKESNFENNNIIDEVQNIKEGNIEQNSNLNDIDSSIDSNINNKKIDNTDSSINTDITSDIPVYDFYGNRPYKADKQFTDWNI
jgi:hypothetical protein